MNLQLYCYKPNHYATAKYLNLNLNKNTFKKKYIDSFLHFLLWSVKMPNKKLWTDRKKVRIQIDFRDIIVRTLTNHASTHDPIQI